MPKAPKLALWNGLPPKLLQVDERKRGVLIAAVDVDALSRGERVPLGDRWLGLWGSDGELVVGVPGTQLMEFIPGRDEVALVRQEGIRRPKWHVESWFERWSLDGKRKSQLLLDKTLPMANLALLTFPAKSKARVAKIQSADEDGRYAFFVKLDSAGQDRAAATLDELEGKTAAVDPRKLAENLLTPPAELIKLASQSVELAIAVGRNCAAPPTLLSELARHEDPKVRAAVATNGGLRVPDQKRLARDRDPHVRLALFSMGHVRNPKTGRLEEVSIDPSVDEILAKDADPRVRAAWVKANRGAVSSLDGEPLAARLAAVQWGISIERERELASDPSAEVRLKLAISRHPRKCGRSPSIDGAALALLLKDSSKRVREAAAALSPYPEGTRTPPP